LSDHIDKNEACDFSSGKACHEGA